MEDEFINYLNANNLSQNTINSYLFSLRHFCKTHDITRLTKGNLLKYKMELIEHYRPQTVNLRLRALNCYLESVHKEKLKLSTVKVQSRTFLENVISEADYEYFKRKLKTYDIFWYFVVRFMAATGARINELLQIKVEHVRMGYLDLYSKGGKVRRIYIPAKLQKEALKWIDKHQIKSGFLFTNRFGERFTSRGIAGRLKILARKFGINTKVVYPHSFRHLFAKNFLARCSDIAFLADLMGHESIETTRIYLRRTSTEQRALIDAVVNW